MMVLAMPGKPLEAGLFESGFAGLADRRAAALVFVVGRHIADAGVQPHAVVALPNKGELGAQHPRVPELVEVGPFGLDVAEQRFDPGLVGRGAGTAEVLVDRAQGHELAGRPARHLRAVVAEGQQHRPGGIINGKIHQPVLTGPDQLGQPLALHRLTEHDLDLGGGLLGRDDLGQPLTADQVLDHRRGHPARVKWVVSKIQIELGVYSTQSGNGLRTDRPGCGRGRSRRPSRSSTRRTLEGDTHTRSRYEPRWASLRCERSISPHWWNNATIWS